MFEFGVVVDEFLHFIGKQIARATIIINYMFAEKSDAFVLCSVSTLKCRCYWLHDGTNELGNFLYLILFTVITKYFVMS